METLLTKNHPDIPKRIANTCKKYTHLDIKGEVLECLERQSTDNDFVDVTEIEKERVKILNYDKELRKLKNKADKCKTEVYDYEEEDSNRN